MITLNASGGSVTFTFSGNSTYLNDGVITCPINSLALIIDESDMVTFKKSQSSDIFVSANIAEFGMTKAELETWFKENAVGSTGGGGGVTPSEVQTMIDESISGKADSSAVTEEISAAVSGYADSCLYDDNAKAVKFYHGGTGGTEVYSFDASPFLVDGMIDDVRIETISGVTYLVIDFNTASGKEDILIPITDIFNPDNYYTKSETSGATELSTAFSAKLDATAYTPVQVSTAITENDTNPVAGGAVYDKVHVTSGESSETTLIFEERTVGGTQAMYSTNYPSGATIVKLDINNVPSYVGYFGWYGADESFLGGAKITQDGGNIGVNFSYSDITAISGTASYTDNVLTVEVTGFQNASLSDIAYFSHDLMSTYNSIKAVTTPKEYWIKEYVDAQTSGLTEEITAAVSGKADSSDVYTKSEVDNTISAATDDMATETWVGEQGYITGVDLSNYATTVYVDGAVSGKVETSAITSAVTSASTDSEIPTAKAVFDAIPTGGTGGGKAISAGTNISVTTGETADTVSCTIPAYRSGSSNGISLNYDANTASGTRSIAGGSNCKATSENAVALGYNSEAKNDNTFAMGQYAIANGFVSMSLGRETITNNRAEFACGQDNVSNKASNTYGDSGNTLFSIGNGEYGGTRHNAFEVRQNGDIYITSGGTDILLQDHLGGGGQSCTVDEFTIYDVFTSSYENYYGNKPKAKYAVLDYSGDKTTSSAQVHVEVGDDSSTYYDNWIYLDYPNHSGSTAEGVDPYVDITYDSTIEDFIISVPSGLTTSWIKQMYNVDGTIITPRYEIESGDSCSVIETSIKNTLQGLNDATNTAVNSLSISSDKSILEVAYFRYNGNNSSTNVNLIDLDGSDNKLKTNIQVGTGVSGWTEVQFNGSCNLAENPKTPIFRMSGDTSDLANFNKQWFNTQWLVTLEHYGNNWDSISWDDNENKFVLSSSWFGEGGSFGTATVTYDDVNNVLTVAYPLTASVDTYTDDVVISQFYNNNCYFGSEITKFEYCAELKQPIREYVQQNRAALGGLKLSHVTQAQYDAMEQAGTLDSNTLYVITDN